MLSSNSSPAKFSSERRSNPRVPLLTQVESVADGSTVLGQSQDISEGGLQVAAGQTLDAGTEVVVRFNLPPYPPGFNVRSRGMVAWVRAGQAMGIRFLQLEDEQCRAIAGYVSLGGRMTRLGPL